MNKATIYAFYFSNANRFICDVQIFICIDGYPYFGEKRFLAMRHALTLEQALEFCKNYNVSEDQCEWHVEVLV